MGQERMWTATLNNEPKSTETALLLGLRAGQPPVDLLF